MAKVSGPLHSSEARGRVGGIIFNTWRGISSVKSFCSPAQPRTERQLNIRAWMTQLIRAFGALGDPYVSQWNTYAQLNPVIDWTGNPKRITGLNWFCKLNLIMLDLGKVVASSPPASLPPASPVAFVATGSTGQISCAFTVHAGTTTTIDIWTHGPHSAGVVGKLERAKHRSYGPAETTPLVVSGLSPGTYTVYARNLDEANGQSSVWVSDVATVT